MASRNPPLDLLPGAAWTSTVERMGWRQFRVVGRRYANGGLEIELMAVCDPGVRFWLPAAELADRAHFMRGWRLLSTLQENEPSAAVDYGEESSD